MSFHDFLDQKNDDYQKAQVHEIIEVEDGTYQAIVENASLYESKKGEFLVRWRFKIVGPKNEGGVVFMYNSFDKSRIMYLKKNLSVLGIGKMNSLKDDLIGNLESVDGQLVEIAVTTNKNGYQSVFLNKKIKDGIETQEETLPF